METKPVSSSQSLQSLEGSRVPGEGAAGAGPPRPVLSGAACSPPTHPPAGRGRQLAEALPGGCRGRPSSRAGRRAGRDGGEGRGGGRRVRGSRRGGRWGRLSHMRGAARGRPGSAEAGDERWGRRHGQEAEEQERGQVGAAATTTPPSPRPTSPRP